MTKEKYIKMTQPFRDHPEMAKGIHIANKLCTGIMYVAYPLLLLYLLFHRESSYFSFRHALLVPGISFVLLSVVRALINRPRPYEKFDVAPVIKRDTKGNSFPSRHVFCAAIISMTFIFMSPWNWLGLIFFVITLLLAVVRVVSGVHYVSDVVAGVFCGILAALLGYVFFY